jgi:hypothetical protein
MVLAPFGAALLVAVVAVVLLVPRLHVPVSGSQSLWQ